MVIFGLSLIWSYVGKCAMTRMHMIIRHTTDVKYYLSPSTDNHTGHRYMASLQCGYACVSWDQRSPWRLHCRLYIHTAYPQCVYADGFGVDQMNDCCMGIPDTYKILWSGLTLSTLGKIFSRWHIEIFFLFFSEDRIWHFIQTILNGDNLREISNPVFWEKLEKYHQFVVCCIGPESSKSQSIMQNCSRKMTCFYFSEKISVDISGRSSAQQVIHLKRQALLFSEK